MRRLRKIPCRMLARTAVQPRVLVALIQSQAAQAQCVSLIVNTCSFILRNLKWP